MSDRYGKLKREDLEALVASSLALSRAFGIEGLLDSILREACRLTDSPDSALFLPHDDEQTLYFASATGDKAQQVLDMFGRNSLQSIPLGSKAGQVFQTGEPLITGDLAEDAKHFKGSDKQTGHETESMVCVPLIVGTKAIGAVQLLNRRSGSYGERDLQLLETFASHAAVAIRNARLVDTLLAHMGINRTEGPTTAFDLVDELNQPPIEEELTVLFADMRSFTKLAQVVGSDELQRILNDYLTMLCDEVLRNDGIVNKLVGDGIVALFRGDEDHPRRAAECAFSMVDEFDRLRQKWHAVSNFDLDFIDIGIGIAADSVTLTTVGSRQVKDFTPIGSAVNLANALEVAARNGKRILSNQTVYTSVADLVEVDDEPQKFELTKPGQGDGAPYSVYQLIKRSGQLDSDGPVFLSHNSDDKPTVKALAAELKQRGLRYWLDEEHIVPGRSIQAAIERGLRNAGSAAIMLGPSGYGPWEVPEIRAALKQLVDREMPVIPVFLPGAPEDPEVPLFLEDLKWIDMRAGLSPEVLDQLEWGIRGERDGDPPANQ